MTQTTVRRALTGIGLALLSAATAHAQQQAHPTRADVNGEWEGPLELEGGTQNISLVFRLTDSTFAGTAYTQGRKFGDMESGTFSGDTVKFHVDAFVFTGVISGDKMKIALIVYNGSTRNFVATKKATDNGGLGGRQE